MHKYDLKKTVIYLLLPLCILSIGSNALADCNSANIDCYASIYDTAFGSNSYEMGGYDSSSGTYSGKYNTAIGVKTLYSTTSTDNTAVGYRALYSDTTGGYNSAFGSDSLYSNTTGSINTAVGWIALNENTTGDRNTGVGGATLYRNTTGSYNAALGYGALSGNTTGSNNIALGYQAGNYNSTGSNNVNLGHQAGHNNVSGSGNVFIGYQAGYSETGSNKLYIDNSNTSSPLIYGDFDANSVTINGDATVTGTLTADTIQNSSGNNVIRYDSTNEAVHIGQNSMIFYDAAGSIGNGTDIMASSTGKIQIGRNSTDTTTFVGEVNVPEPTKSSHAANKKYVDSIGAVALAAVNSQITQGDGRYLSAGTAVVDGQAALAIGLGFVADDISVNLTTSYNPALKDPAIATSVSWRF
jgi:hypothetical protein